MCVKRKNPPPLPWAPFRPSSLSQPRMEHSQSVMHAPQNALGFARSSSSSQRTPGGSGKSDLDDRKGNQAGQWQKLRSHFLFGKEKGRVSGSTQSPSCINFSSATRVHQVSVPFLKSPLSPRPVCFSKLRMGSKKPWKKGAGCRRNVRRQSGLRSSVDRSSSMMWGTC